LSLVGQKSPSVNYKKTPLFAYYNCVQPSIFEEFWKLAGNETDIGPFARKPMGFYCNWSPWSSTLSDTPEDIINGRTLAKRCPDYESHLHGPTADSIGAKELRRLYKLLIKLKDKGYTPEINKDGYIRGYIMRRNGESRFLITGGGHRAGVLDALGYNWITVKLQPNTPALIDRADFLDWPQVLNDLFTPEQALCLFDGIFESNGRTFGKMVMEFMKGRYASLDAYGLPSGW
jgi:hypothetical protein